MSDIESEKFTENMLKSRDLKKIRALLLDTQPKLFELLYSKPKRGTDYDNLDHKLGK